MRSRSIIVGDVHGCARELQSLLEEVGWTSADRVFFVGDLVARGPDTPGVLRQMRRLGGRGVLGNHEDRLLDARRARAEGRPAPHLGPSHQRLLRELSPEDWQLIEDLPLTLELPEHGLCIVHAGVVPKVPLTQQKRRDLLKMRALEPDGSGTSSWRARPWAADYHDEPHIVFGHNALSGLQLYPQATGLDTGCVYGGRLTALVLEEGAGVLGVDRRAEQLVSVPALARYVDFGPRFEAGGE